MIGFIQNLIAKQKHLEAVEYAYAFELTGHFLPIPILKDYLKQVMQISECVCIGETCSVKEKNEAIEQSVASIKAVIRCIMDHELQSQYPPSQLEECIESLTRQKADVTASSVISEAQLKQVVSISPSVPTDTKTLSSTSFSGTASTCMLGHSDAMAAILVSMGGKNLQNFLYNHWNEHELLRIEISRALKMSCDSGLLVLEALEGFYTPEPHNEEILFDRSVIRKSCISTGTVDEALTRD
ncbi:FRIGIDA-like protein 3 [Nicotiana tomentosiformis]|uniref:FRIGIDA-like protein n=1 Tax=Nicotiana tabacum TaxID=4097 RepID=A0A1S4AEC8_TOBAC|nr:FRIGIDA-like protein 3 [Nicotiana tomentosiformis]XP_016474974.1 PREDICTED: FRIGIDA-like protein 3 [Nicotiana tabacum]